MTGFNQIFESHWLSRIDEYRHTPRVVFGIGAVNKLGEIAKEVAKNTSALIITDKALEKIGVIESPKKSLEDAGFTIDVYGSEAKEPAVGEIKKAIGIVKGKDYGLVVGIGGGAAMDTAKAGAEEILRYKSVDMADPQVVQEYADDLRSLLAKSSIIEQRSFLKSFVERIEVDESEAKVYYTIPMPPHSISEETVGVLPFVHHG